MQDIQRIRSTGSLVGYAIEGFVALIVAVLSRFVELPMFHGLVMRYEWLIGLHLEKMQSLLPPIRAYDLKVSAGLQRPWGMLFISWMIIRGYLQFPGDDRPVEEGPIVKVEPPTTFADWLGFNFAPDEIELAEKGMRWISESRRS